MGESGDDFEDFSKRSGFVDFCKRNTFWNLLSLFDCPDGFALLEREYLAGKKEALVVAVLYCLSEKIEAPDWVTNNFLNAVFNGSGPWEDDFGKRGKERFIETYSKHLDWLNWAERLFDWIEQRRKENPVDAALFELAGKEFNVSAGTASAVYYSKEVRRKVVLSKTNSAIRQLRKNEIGLDVDAESDDVWFTQNLDRLEDIGRRHHEAVFKRRPRKSKRVISKKIRSKI
jgi:hypothetical protein